MLLPKKIFIGGLGYAGSRIASQFHAAFPNAQISGTVRSKERRDAFLSSPPSWFTGGKVNVLDVDDQYVGLDAAGLDDLLAADTIIQTVAPIADFDRDPLLAFHGDLLQLSDALQYVAYLSSTGVYGNHDGEWVDETSDLRCTDAKSLARVQAEGEWGMLECQSPAAVAAVRVDCFRCGGIYGPGRGPLFSSLQSSPEDDVKQGDTSKNTIPTKYVNRIEVDDIAGAIVTSRMSTRAFYPGGRAYNLVDDDPSPRKIVVEEARRLLLASASSSEADEKDTTILPPPSKVLTRNTRRRISRGTGNKRCRNDRLKKDYGWVPRYPTFREGFSSLLLQSS